MLIRYRTEIEDFSIEAIAESGQCFRIVRKDRACHKVTALGRVLEVTACEDGSYGFSCSREEFDAVWRHYFDLDNDYEVYKSAALKDDDYLNRAIEFGSGIRILNQDPWEMLISFIISQRKSVPAIRTSVERLSESFGRPLYTEDGSLAGYAFPEAGALVKADTAKLAACGLGYRLDYIRDAAEKVMTGELEPEAMGRLDTPVLIEELMKLKGVGIKVASCVALFGYHRLDTVPVDVWMKRVIETVYNGSLPAEYMPYAGVLQQYMFNYARLHKTGV